MVVLFMFSAETYIFCSNDLPSEVRGASHVFHWLAKVVASECKPQSILASLQWAQAEAKTGNQPHMSSGSRQHCQLVNTW